jgi:hypothetical protein
MNGDWLDEYVSAWQGHVRAGAPDGGPELAELLRHMDPDVRYEDVPSGLRFAGHDGVREMAQSAYAVSNDMAMEVVSSQTDGTSFAFEWISRGESARAPGSTFSFRGVSVGTLTADGLVASHADYWDLAGLLAQLGALTLPDMHAPRSSASSAPSEPASS